MVEMAGDIVLDIDVKPNRGDALSIVGLAREVAAVTERRCAGPTSRSTNPATPRPTTCVSTSMTPSSARSSSVATSRRDRPALALGRPDGASSRPVCDRCPTSWMPPTTCSWSWASRSIPSTRTRVRDGHIRVRRARDGERLETLDHIERDLTSEALLITDDAGPLALAGVMGGASSEVGDDDDERHHRVGHLRPRQRAPYGLPLLPAK